jgi:Domain of unknown function (DUF222)
MFVSAVDEVEGLTDAELTELVRGIERERRRLDARMAAAIREADRRSVYTADGHASISGWLRMITKWSKRQVRQHTQLAHLSIEHRSCVEALHDGRIGTAQACELARVAAHPRVGDRFADVAEVLCGHAERLPFEDFNACVRRFVILADTDGARRDDHASHDARTAIVTVDFDGGAYVQASGGSVAGIEMAEIHRRFIETEFMTDWADVVARHGDEAHVSLLARTAPQRSFDALLAIFRAAVLAPVEGIAPEPVVNIVIDQTTFEHHLALATGTDPGPRDVLDIVERGRWETIEGHPIHPDHAITAAVIGHVRRVVMNSAGTVIDLGRLQRLFTGSARQAVQLQHTHCEWHGCVVSVRDCQIDHRQPWAKGGTTCPCNGDLLCKRHNRLKHHGFTTRRDPDGTWHVYRPDGTEIA